MTSRDALNNLILFSKSYQEDMYRLIETDITKYERIKNIMIAWEDNEFDAPEYFLRLIYDVIHKNPKTKNSQKSKSDNK